MGHRYAVLGAGRQGIAAAYDMAKFGDAGKVLLVDRDADVAAGAAERVNSLLGGRKAEGVQADVGDLDALRDILEDTTSFLSAVPYRNNLGLTELAIATGTNMTDLGGHTGIVRQQLGLHDRAREAGVSIVPDCGMGPGMNISLGAYAMSMMDSPKEVRIWDGGLPQVPHSPWNYALTFNINGLTNEYYGNAFFLREGKITEVPCFEEYEILEFPEPIGKLEAFVTSGGLSTAPWTFEGTLDVLENKTLRFPGHAAQFKAFSQLGLFEEQPINVGGEDVIPREVFHSLLGPKITRPDVKDFAVILVKCSGTKDGEEAEAVIALIDQYDGETGFTAMQRLTGWHASIMAILQARGMVGDWTVNEVENGVENGVGGRAGAVPVELAVPGSVMVEEARKRGFSIETNIETNIVTKNYQT